MIHLSALLARKHGTSEAYAVRVSFGDPKAVYDAYQSVIDPQAGAEFRAAHAEVLFLRENVIVAHHDFPDPIRLEAVRKDGALADALRLREEANAAQSAALRAAAAAKAGAANARQLTEEQKQMLAEHDRQRVAARVRADAELKAKEAAAQEERDRLDAEAAARQAATEAAAAAATGNVAAAAVTEPALPLPPGPLAPPSLNLPPS